MARREDALAQGEAATLWLQERLRVKPQSILSSYAAPSSEAASNSLGRTGDCNPGSMEYNACGRRRPRQCSSSWTKRP